MIAPGPSVALVSLSVRAHTCVGLCVLYQSQVPDPLYAPLVLTLSLHDSVAVEAQD